MKTKLHCLILFFCVTITSVSVAQSSFIVWQKTVGGNDTDSLTSLSVGNNAFVVCGASKSKQSGSKSTNSAGGFDYWVVKMDFSGNILWNKTFGGAKDDIATCVITTSDGGYLVGGTSISDKSATKTEVSFKGSGDYWVLKLDENGNKIWDKTIGGIYTDNLTSLTELSSERYMLSGYSFSDAGGSKTSADIGAENTADYWMVMLDKNGSLLSQNVFGGTSMDALTCMSPSGAGSVYLGGYSYSLKYSGYKTILPVGNNDFWILRSDLAGKVQSELGFGGSLSDYLTCMQVLPDSSLILGGYSNSPASGSKSGNFLGVTDYYVVKTKPDGTEQWNKTFGGARGDYLMSVQQTKDGGFILAGYSNSNAGNNKTQNSKGGNDYWLVKTDSSGKKLWDKTFGGSGDDKLAGIYEIAQDQFIIAGTSVSPVSGDKTNGTVGNTGAADYWILRLGNSSTLDKKTSAPIASLNNYASLNVSPNPVKNTLTITYQTERNSKANLVIYSSGGNTVLKAALPSAAVAVVLNFGVANLSKGTYYMVMYTGNKKISKSFVKE